MIWARRLRQAGLATGLAAFALLACEADTISLLPPVGGSAGQASGATGGTGNAAGSSDNASGDGPSLGEAGNDGGGAVGNAPSGGTPSFGGSSCNGPSCGGFVNTGGAVGVGGGSCVPGYDNCTPCGPQGQCPLNLRCSSDLGNVCVTCIDREDYCGKDAKCDVLTGRCVPVCQDGEFCFDGRVCDKAQGVCVQCVDDHDCDRIRPEMICHQRRCVACEVSDDCPGRGPRYCVNYDCLECLRPQDCPNGKECDRGHCL